MASSPNKQQIREKNRTWRARADTLSKRKDRRNDVVRSLMIAWPAPKNYEPKILL